MRMFIVWKNEIYYEYPSLKVVLSMPLLELKGILEEVATSFTNVKDGGLVIFRQVQAMSSLTSVVNLQVTTLSQ